MLDIKTQKFERSVIVVMEIMCLAFFRVVAIITNLSTFTGAKLRLYFQLVKFFFSVFSVWGGLCIFVFCLNFSADE